MTSSAWEKLTFPEHRELIIHSVDRNAFLQSQNRDSGPFEVFIFKPFCKGIYALRKAVLYPKPTVTISFITCRIVATPD